MDIVTYVVDAKTFVNNIHELKLWIYDGSIRILVPICTVEWTKQQYNASLIPKEAPKETTGRKAYGKAGRKDQPPALFDINPRTAWEFLTRAKSDEGELGVTFQSPEETFTQWKEEEQEMQKVESPQAPPTSFADALLRRLNINDGSNSNGSKGASKPRLVARSSEPKSPWKYLKVPNIPSTAIPAELQSYFSCVFWCFYESANDPLDLKTYRIMSDNSTVSSLAAAFDIPAQTSSSLHRSLRELALSQDHREIEGQLEQEFARSSENLLRAHEESKSCQNVVAVNGHRVLGISDPLLKDEETITSHEFKITDAVVPAEPKELVVELLRGFGHDGVSAPHITQTPPHNSYVEPSTGANQTSPGPSAMAVTDYVPNLAKEPALPLAAKFERSSDPSPKYNDASAPKAELDDDSDEEVIVFNPRAKRASGRPKTPGEAPKSRPTTAHGQVAAQPQVMKIAKSPIISNLKPQSPAFTPGKTYVTINNANLDKKSSSVDERHAESSKGSNGAPRSPQSKSSQPKNQRHSGHVKSLSQDNLQRQQSELIIQRQREAIQRQSKTVAKTPPRQVQMEPTEHPTIIDPDAFDRSYVVQQPNQASPVPSGKQRAAGKPRRSPKGSPKRPSRAPVESEVDYVLKSGNPRGSMRGKGKLWVP